MGGSVSYISKHVRRFMNRYNAQNRALDLLDKEKLSRAPRHSTYEAMRHDIGSTIPPDFLAKDPKLGEYLKDVFVKSYQKPEMTSFDSNRPLPEKREYEKRVKIFSEPVEVEKGFATLTTVMQFLADYQSNPQLSAAAEIAKKHDLDEKLVRDILKYHSVFQLYSRELITAMEKQETDFKKALEVPQTGNVSETPEIVKLKDRILTKAKKLESDAPVEEQKKSMNRN